MNIERRQHQRKLQQERVVVNAVTADKQHQAFEYECSSRDLSAKGIRLHGNHPLELNCELDLQVHLQNAHMDYSLTGVVKWVTETTEHEHLAGVELDSARAGELSRWQSLF